MRTLGDREIPYMDRQIGNRPALGRGNLGEKARENVAEPLGGALEVDADRLG